MEVPGTRPATVRTTPETQCSSGQPQLARRLPDTGRGFLGEFLLHLLCFAGRNNSASRFGVLRIADSTPALALLSLRSAPGPK